MSQRDSGYERKERDLYETPPWATQALLPHLRSLETVWEPACGGGKMSNALSASGLDVQISDIAHGNDFFFEPAREVDAIITNPPYEMAQAFIERALRLMERAGGLVAMLLRTDFDHAKSRAHLFRDCPAFAKKIVLMKRIVWFEPEPGSKGKSPSFNHAWYVWDWRHAGPPSIAYGPTHATEPRAKSGALTALQSDDRTDGSTGSSVT